MEKLKVRSVCIDDFALKKRQRYGTVMVDMETHKIVDMVESREMEDVQEWLSGYPNLRIASRDGSQTYAAAISAAHPSAMQVSDRFHILKNLNAHATPVFQKLFQGRIPIPITEGTRRIRYEVLIGTAAGRIRFVKKLRKEGRSLNEIVLLTGMTMRMVKKYLAIDEANIPVDKPTVRGREHDEAVQKLLERAGRVKVLQEGGMSITAICQKTGFSSAAVKSYLSADFTPVNAHYGKQREGKLEPFREEILQMKANGRTYREIYEHIRVKGYGGTQDAIRVFMSKERRIRRDLQTAAGGEPVELIDKKWIIRLLYKPIGNIKGISPAQLDAIFASYPLAKDVFDIVNEFKALFKAKNPKELTPWMDKAVALHCAEIDTFVNGLKNDIDAVMNAISTNYSNGLVEGTVNKIKVIKRIMYGRCHFSTLRTKCLLLDHSC